MLASRAIRGKRGREGGRKGGDRLALEVHVGVKGPLQLQAAAFQHRLPQRKLVLHIQIYREGDKQVGGGLYREKRRTQQGLTRADGREDIRE